MGTPPRQKSHVCVAFGTVKTSAALLTLTMLLAACGGGGEERLSSAAWAAEFCGLAQTYSDATLATNAKVSSDPTSLSLDARKARAKTLTDGHVAAMQAFKSGLDDIKGPENTDDYQKALAAQLTAMAEEQKRGLAEVEKATSATQIEASNAQFSIVQQRTADDTAEAAKKLSPDTLAAMRGVQKCGALS